MHPCYSIRAEVNATATIVVTKIPLTITERSQGLPRTDGGVYEADTGRDHRFIYSWQEELDAEVVGSWQARFARLWFEKQRLIPMTPA